MRPKASLSILLHGRRSTGKFLTAKALASHFNRPVYTITRADLGPVTWDATRDFGTHFKRAAKWNCIIAIPEAERRFPHRKSPSDGDPGIIDLFLRELELFKGIVVLTTDAKHDVDDEVVRRMNVCLGSSFWSRSENLQVWHRVLKKRGIRVAEENEQLPTGTKAIIGEADYDDWRKFLDGEYSKGKLWNGLEINHYFDIALALAEYDTHTSSGSAHVLKCHHLSMAARIAGDSV